MISSLINLARRDVDDESSDNSPIIIDEKSERIAPTAVSKATERMSKV